MAMMPFGMMNPMMGMGGMMPMMGMGGPMQGIFIMMQMMQMLQMLQMLQGMQGQQGRCGCGMPGMGSFPMGMQMGNMMGMPGMQMPNMGYSQMPWGGGGSWPNISQSYPPFDMGEIRGGTQFGQSLARDAACHANGPGGWCLRWVSQDLARHGVNVGGGSAYQAADQLAQNSRFHEVRGVRNDQLRQLPPGSVVVWDRGPGHEHGHISVALGNGMEASDKLRHQITNYGTGYRVFLPQDRPGTAVA